MHPLEERYGLTADELLTALQRRFRATVTLEGAVAEVHMERKLRQAQEQGRIARYEVHDVDGRPDFSIWLPDGNQPLLAECKNVRDRDEAYRNGGQVVAYKVETQKTRASKDDPSSRYYSIDQFSILGVCLGKKTGNWSSFLFARTDGLVGHRVHQAKLAAIQRVPLPDGIIEPPWYADLAAILETFR